MKTSITNNKYLTPQLKEDNDSVSAKSPAQMLSLNLEQTFLILNFLINGLCNSCASSIFTLAPNPVFLSINLYIILANSL